MMNPSENTADSSTHKKDRWKYLAPPLAILSIYAILFLRPYYIPSGSSEPTINSGDKILSSKFYSPISKPKRGDVVVFRLGLPHLPKETTFISRVIGLEGDTIEIKNGKTLVNGQVIPEEVMGKKAPKGATYLIKEQPFIDHKPVKIPNGSAFLMSDNRNNSMDSRFYGPIPLKKVLAKAIFITSPLNRIGLIH